MIHDLDEGMPLYNYSIKGIMDWSIKYRLTRTENTEKENNN